MTVVSSSVCSAEQTREDIFDLDKLLQATGCGLATKKLQPVVTSISVADQGSKLAYWPPALCQFTAVTSISLSGNAITFIPQSVQTLTGLKVLSVSRNNLTAAPPELSCLTQLTELDLSRNELRALHPALCRLQQLQVLNVMGNQINRLPEQFGDLTGLIRLGLKSNQLTELPAGFTQLTSLVELFITDNKLTTLPQGFGNLKSLVKLQASFNAFTHLPDGLWQLPQLEMFRLAVGHLDRWPADLTQIGGLPNLTWCSLGGNPAAAPVPEFPADLPQIDISGLVLGEKLGQGASGEVFRGVYQGRDVAIKIFVADVSPDGSTREELAINCHVNHPNLTKVLALVVDPNKGADGDQTSATSNFPSNSTEAEVGSEGAQITGMVLELVIGKPLAGRPTSEHLLRCKWPDGQVFSVATTLSVCHGVASSLAYLHSEGICHGDVYAHNIMVNQQAVQQGLPARPVMCDFGAAYCYNPATAGGFWESMEVRAFGLFMEDMVGRTASSSATVCEGSSDPIKLQLNALVARCLAMRAVDRPGFSSLVSQLLALMKATDMVVPVC